MDTTAIGGIVEATREAGVWNVPTLSLVENLAAPDAPETMIQAPVTGTLDEIVRRAAGAE